MRTVHVVGAGLAGLSCALRLAEAGERVVCYEGTNHAGGRCRSYFDAALDRTIDNGNHLLLSSNGAALSYLAAIGAGDSLVGPAAPLFPFIDLASGERWTLRMSLGRLPWWILSQRMRVPGTRARDYAALLRLARARGDETVAAVVDTEGPLFRRLIEPLVVAVLNTEPANASAALLGRMIVETFGRGGSACRPLIAKVGLAASLVDPALKRLGALGVTLLYTHRLRVLESDGGRVAALRFMQRSIPVAADDLVVLALPAQGAQAILPGLRGPGEHRAIVNAHFRLPRAGLWQGEAPFVGLIGGTAHWLFFRDDVASATVSAANDLVDEPAEAIAAAIWPEVAAVLGIDAGPLPPYRIVKEKLATFAQTPQAVTLRPGTKTHLANLLLAGDWTDTGLPATIEGAIRSGYKAADAALALRPGTKQTGETMSLRQAQRHRASA